MLFFGHKKFPLSYFFDPVKYPKEDSNPVAGIDYSL